MFVSNDPGSTPVYYHFIPVKYDSVNIGWQLNALDDLVGVKQFGNFKNENDRQWRQQITKKQFSHQPSLLER